MPFKIGILVLLLMCVAQVSGANECRGRESRYDNFCSTYDNYKNICRTYSDRCCWYRENPSPCRGETPERDWACKRNDSRFSCETARGCEWTGKYICD